MNQGWRLLDADEDERRTFPDLDATLRRATSSTAAAAGPTNRFREVRRLRVGGRVYYLKIFHRTQLKNRLRFLLTAPRCASDAERELGMARALLQRGVATARPVAIGRRGPSSYYLCAELAGTPLREVWAGGRRERRERRQVLAAARFCGGLACQGLLLPDLSADHVFLPAPAGEDAGSGPALAVLDLHNGSLLRRNRLPPRAAARILRRFGKSVRGLSVPRRLAMAFAVALLRAGGLTRQERRATLARVPPFDTFGRYEVPGRAPGYRQRNPARAAAELAMLQGVWPPVARGSLVLDCPAGTGRLHRFLGVELGLQPIGADRALAMLQEAAAQDQGSWLVQADASRLPLPDRSVAATVVFRLLHHLPPAAARELLAEAARVSDRFLVVSFFHPVSLHGLSRRLRELLTGRTRTRHAVSWRRLQRWLAEVGFVPCKVTAQRRYLRDFWLASFQRRA